MSFSTQLLDKLYLRERIAKASKEELQECRRKCVRRAAELAAEINVVVVNMSLVDAETASREDRAAKEGKGRRKGGAS